MSEWNLEQFCAHTGLELIEEYDGSLLDEVGRMLQKSIGILQSNGIYAFLIWLDYQHTKSEHIILPMQSSISRVFTKYLRKEFLTWNHVKDSLKDSTLRIEDIFMLKGLLQKTLTYSLYLAKSQKELSNLNEQEGN